MTIVVPDFNPCDRSTWPEVLRRPHLAAIWGLSAHRIDIKRKRGEMPDPLPSGHEWTKAAVCEWLDNPRSRRGCRVSRRVA